MSNELVAGKGFRLLSARLIDIQDKLPESIADATGVVIEYAEPLEQILEQDDGALETFLRLDLHLDVANTMEVLAMDMEYVLNHIEGIETDGVELEILLNYWLVDNDTVKAEIDKDKLYASLAGMGVDKDESWEKTDFVMELASAHLYDNCQSLNEALHRCLDGSN